jgi:thioredoxin 1
MLALFPITHPQTCHGFLSWCGPCKLIAPLYAELSEEFGDVIFVKVDVDENPELAAKYSVSAMPTFVFIKDGDVVDRLMGANPTRLQELIEEYK